MVVSQLEPKTGHGLVAVKFQPENRMYTFKAPHLLPGEHVTLKVAELEVKMPKGRRKPVKNAEFALVSSNSPSPFEIEQAKICPNSRTCSGCQFQNLQYEKQMQEKLSIVTEKLGVEPFVVELQNKKRSFVRLRFEKVTKNRFFSISSPGKSSSIESCPMLSDRMNRVMMEMGRQLSRRFAVFDPHRGEGVLKELILKEVGSSILVGLVIAPTLVEDEVRRTLLTLKGGETISGVLLAVSDQDDSRDAEFELITGNSACQSVPIRERGPELAISLKSESFESEEAMHSILRSLVDLVRDEKVLIVSASEESLLRQCLWRERLNDIFFVNHGKCEDDSAKQFYVNMKEKEACEDNVLDRLPVPELLIVAGHFSEKLRNWAIANRIPRLLYFTEDANKIAWDMEHFRGSYVLDGVKVFDLLPHNMKMFVLAEAFYVVS
jgi:hypothetical protein